MMSVDPNTITIEDCIDMYERKGFVVIIENGKIVEFLQEG